MRESSKIRLRYQCACFISMLCILFPLWYLLPQTGHQASGVIWSVFALWTLVLTRVFLVSGRQLLLMRQSIDLLNGQLIVNGVPTLNVLTANVKLWNPYFSIRQNDLGEDVNFIIEADTNVTIPTLSLPIEQRQLLLRRAKEILDK